MGRLSVEYGGFSRIPVKTAYRIPTRYKEKTIHRPIEEKRQRRRGRTQVDELRRT
jgi:hypothetical protein